ncbi:hypothetical protein GDO78_014560 [Eleutherodactylus coqui]|uniref:Uncharacterized protein n=1 Tax=Eleutherodactylus coqui TaxID=57060 RepID=A0A8J6JX13_ELECQ|nr:hypothetical protein GDO78_014560 [Eleutherodactylus coqui]
MCLSEYTRSSLLISHLENSISMCFKSQNNLLPHKMFISKVLRSPDIADIDSSALWLFNAFCQENRPPLVWKEIAEMLVHVFHLNLMSRISGVHAHQLLAKPTATTMLYFFFP